MISTYVVVVCHNEKPDLERKTRRLFGHVKVEEFIIVDTACDLKIGNDVYSSSQVNELCEFTGYSFGIAKAMSIASIGDEIRCYVLNDTVFVSHYTFLFKRLISLESQRKVQEFSVGGVLESRFHGDIIPSCFFVLSGPKSSIESAKLYTEKTASEVKQSRLYNSEEFTSHLHKWLHPKSFFKGWYKAKVFTSMSKCDLDRKSISICLEWSLVQNLINQGCTVHNFGALIEIRVWKLLDRIYCNLLKLRNRVSELISLFYLKCK